MRIFHEARRDPDQEYRASTLELFFDLVFVVAVGVTFYQAKWILWQSLLFGVVLAVPAFWLLRKKFEQVSGGLSYKIK